MIMLAVSCTPMPDHIAFSDPVPTGSIQEIYVTTGRLPSTDAADIKQDRTAKTQFVRYGVSVPATHEIGQIEWPDVTVDPETDFAVVDVDDLHHRDGFISHVRAEPGDEAAVFVHGYNNTPSEALYRFAQIGHDFEITSPRILFSWPSAGTATGYVYDRDSVLFSRDPLAELLTTLSRSTDKKITLMAHSMGAHLTMEVLRQLSLTGRRDVLRNLDGVVLFAPDIDPDIFRAQANAIGTLPDPFIIMTNRHSFMGILPAIFWIWPWVCRLACPAIGAFSKNFST